MFYKIKVNIQYQSTKVVKLRNNLNQKKMIQHGEIIETKTRKLTPNPKFEKEKSTKMHL